MRSPKNKKPQPSQSSSEKLRKADASTTSPQTDSPSQKKIDRLVGRTSWVVGLLITLAAVQWHGWFLLNAGGLWRDETNAVHMAALPTLAEMWQMLTRESFPALFFLIVRAWMALGLGGSDLELRWLGLAIGLALLASIWFASRMLRRGVPVLALALLALNLTIVRAGDSLRAYGLGSVFIILLLALMWRFVRNPTLSGGVWAALVAVLSVQCLYQNSFFVLAICGGAVAVCAWQRQRRKAAYVVGIGAVAAISLVPYIPVILRSQDFFILARTGFQPALVWEKASTAMGFPLAGYNLVWVFLVLLAIALALRMVRSEAGASSASERQMLALYTVVALLVGLVGFILFLKLAGLPTQAWYYTPVLAFVAVGLDTILFASNRWVRGTLVLFAALTALLAYPAGFHEVKSRQTNVDLIGDWLNRAATTNDFIIVHPFYCGPVFQRYYHGAAAWTTLPPLADYRVMRYDLFKTQMQLSNPIQPVLDRIATTLQSSNRVWVVGWIPLDGKRPPEMRPAPDNPWGWLDEPYSQIWAAQAGYFITKRADQADVLQLSTNRVNPFENLPLVLVNGWNPGKSTGQQ